MLNHIVLMGRLTRDPERRYLENGTPTASFVIAVERDYTKKDEEKQTDFIPIAAWRNTAEFVSKYFTKGQLIAVSGRLQIRTWVDRDNIKHSKTEVVADNVYFAESKRKDDTPPGTQDPYTSPVSGDPFEEIYDGESDLPY